MPVRANHFSFHRDDRTVHARDSGPMFWQILDKIFFSDKSLEAAAELHEDEDVSGETGAAVARCGVHGQPGQRIVRLQNIPATSNIVAIGRFYNLCMIICE